MSWLGFLIAVLIVCKLAGVITVGWWFIIMLAAIPVSLFLLLVGIPLLLTLFISTRD